jgi:hypothetical protein
VAAEQLMHKFLKYGIIAAIAFIVSILGIDRIPQLITIIGISIAGIYFILRKVDKKMRTKVAILFLVAFLLHVSISIFLYNKTVDTKYYGFSYRGDDYVYGDFGVIVGNLWRRGIFPALKKLVYFNLIGGSAEVQAYQSYCAVISYLFGTCGGQILLILNCFFHAAIVIPAYFLCKGLNMRNKGITFTLFLFLFWPSTFYWSLFNFKEPLMLFSLLAMFSLYIKLQQNPRPRDMFIFVFFSLVLISMKSYLVVIVPFVLLYFIFVRKWKYKNAAIITFSSLFILRQILKKPLFSNIFMNLSRIPLTLSNIRHSCYFTNTGYFWNLSTDTYLGSILYFPLGFLATLFLPFLLRPFTLSHVAANIESITWWALMPFLIGGIWISVKTELRKTFLMLLVFFYWMSMLALTQASMGTLIRQKAIVYYIGFIFIGLAIDRAINGIGKSGHQA